MGQNTIAAPVITIYLPDVICPFPWKLHERFEDVERNMISWAADVFGDYPTVRHRLKHLQRSKFMMWLCMLYPQKSPSELQSWGRFTTAFTLFDDASELARLDGQPNDSWWADPVPLLREGLDLLQVRRGKDTELVNSSRLPLIITKTINAIAQMCGAATLEGREDLLQCIGEVMDGIIIEGEINASAKAEELDLTAYLNLRQKTYGQQIYAAGAVDDTRRRFDNAKELRDPRLKELRRFTILHMALANDLYSFRKEYMENYDRIESMVNLVAILHRDMTWQQAIDRCVELIYDAERRYISIRDAWLEEGDPSGVVRDVSRRLEFLIAGNLQFMKVTPRYHGSYFTGEFHGGMVICDPADRHTYHPDIPVLGLAESANAASQREKSLEPHIPKE